VEFLFCAFASGDKQQTKCRENCENVSDWELGKLLVLYGEQRWMQLGGYGGRMKGTNVKTNT